MFYLIYEIYYPWSINIDFKKWTDRVCKAKLRKPLTAKFPLFLKRWPVSVLAEVGGPEAVVEKGELLALPPSAPPHPLDLLGQVLSAQLSVLLLASQRIRYWLLKSHCAISYHGSSNEFWTRCISSMCQLLIEKYIYCSFVDVSIISSIEPSEYEGDQGIKKGIYRVFQYHYQISF